MIGDFTGFSFAGVHCSELGITRVSEGDRYEETLHPDIADLTAEVPGMNGEYYFGSTYGNKSISISIAFDSITEEQFRKIRTIFGRKQIGELIFDERPYKKYLAKIESPIELSYVCFDERTKTPSTIGEPGIQWETTNGERQRKTIYPYVISETPRRVYKGEGQIDFICYYPFAKSVFKVLPENVDSTGWAVSSGILSSNEYNGIDTYTSWTSANDGNEQTTTYGIQVYNAGDLPTGFRLYIPFVNGATQDISLIYTVNNSVDSQKILNLDAMTHKGEDVGVIIDTNNNLIIGVNPQSVVTTNTTENPVTNEIEVTTVTTSVGITYDINGNAQYSTSGNLYNEFIDSGSFFKLEPNDRTDNAIIEIIGGEGDIEIFYDYLYF